MKVLLDTQAALYAWGDPERLSERAREVMEDSGNTLYFSQASTWEIVIKYGLGKLKLPKPPGSYLPDRIRRSEMEYLPISDRALFHLLKLPDVHRDPFDRLLVATAIMMRVGIVSGDAVFEGYPVRVVW